MSNNDRIIKNTKIYLTRQDGATLAFGEGEKFEIYEISGLGIGEVEKETAGSALNDGELWLGSKVTHRILDITTRWDTASYRATFMDFFQHNMRFDARILFNGDEFSGSCLLDEAYNAEDHKGRLYVGSDIELSLYFDDPYFYTGTLYDYQIGFPEEGYFNFYTLPEQHEIAVPPMTGYEYIFSLITEAREYAVTNPSSTANGIQAEIIALGKIRNPILRNLTTGLELKLGRPGLPLDLVPGDVLLINTQQRFVAATLNGVDVLQRYLTIGSRMAQVQPGLNYLMFDADEGGNMAECRITFRGKVLAL